MYAKTHNNVFIRIQILDLKLPFGSSTVASKPYHRLGEFLKNFYLVLLSLKTITISSFHLSIGRQRKVVSVKVKNWREMVAWKGILIFSAIFCVGLCKGQRFFKQVFFPGTIWPQFIYKTVDLKVQSRSVAFFMNIIAFIFNYFHNYWSNKQKFWWNDKNSPTVVFLLTLLDTQRSSFILAALFWWTTDTERPFHLLSY